MITDLHEFRNTIFDRLVCEEENGKLILADCEDDRIPKELYHKLYKECDISRFPEEFKKTINSRMNTGCGIAAGWTYDNEKFLFTKIKGKYHCFERIDKIPKFNIKLKNLSFQHVKKFTDENNLEIRCRLRKNNVERDFVSGNLYIALNYQEYFEKENATGIEEIDEFFFWRGKNYKTLGLDFRYNKQYSDVDINKIKDEIILLFQKGNREIFANEWRIIK